MLHPIAGLDERTVRSLTSIAGRGYHADSHLFLTLPAILMGVAIAACGVRSSDGVLVTLVALNAICALAAVLGLRRVHRTLQRLELGRDKETPHGS